MPAGAAPTPPHGRPSAECCSPGVPPRVTHVQDLLLLPPDPCRRHRTLCHRGAVHPPPGRSRCPGTVQQQTAQAQARPPAPPPAAACESGQPPASSTSRLPEASDQLAEAAALPPPQVSRPEVVPAPPGRRQAGPQSQPEVTERHPRALGRPRSHLPPRGPGPPGRSGHPPAGPARGARLRRRCRARTLPARRRWPTSPPGSGPSFWGRGPRVSPALCSGAKSLASSSRLGIGSTCV